MNAGLPDDHPSIRYYDSDYPGRATTVLPSNLDPLLERQGLAHDVDWFLSLAARGGGTVLELCCGTGRVTVPLARAGHHVTAVDLSAPMLERLRARLAAEPPETAARVVTVQQDVTRLAVDGRFDLIIVPFNSLLCIPDFAQQLRALTAAAAHLRPGGRVALDLVNPLVLPLAGDPVPKPFLSRRREDNGRAYTRFAAFGPLGADQVQELFGWYDEIDASGAVHRTPYSLRWRPIFRYEAELMVEAAGLEVEAVLGGHRGEPFTASTPKLLVVARSPRSGS